MGKTCAICGKNSGMFPLCISCFKLKDAGEIEKCEKCGTWYKTADGCSNCNSKNESRTKSLEKTEEATCCTCGKASHGRHQCKTCYQESLNYIDNINRNRSIADIQDHYFSLLDSIWKMKKPEYIQSNCNRLIALAIFNCNTNKSNYLIEKCYKDVEKIIQNKINTPPKIKIDLESERVIESDKRQERLRRTLDGHYVKSDKEQQIDDLLYQNGIIHSYGQQIYEFPDGINKFCDWFIPVKSATKGIYIEYYGMDTPEYLRDKEEKEKLYKEYNVARIAIEKDEINGDSQGFTARLVRNLKSIARERFQTELTSF